MAALPPSLLRAYRHTGYVVTADRGSWTLRLDEPAPAEFDEWVRSTGAQRWAFVTAWNPGSVATPRAKNEAAQAALVAAVEARQWPWAPGVGRPLEPGWEPEVSLLVLGPDEAEAVALGRAFGQRAVVCGDLGAPARLVLCG